ncbi:MAG: hypothetical protein ACAI44_04165, partial [Candidatus Sericytochromatia bacterium]
KTKNNGLDEVYFTSGGRSYIAYGDSLNLSGLKRNQIPTVTFNSTKADVVAYDDEANSVWEGMSKGAVDEVKNGMTAVRTAVSNLVTTVTPAVAAVGGVGVAGLGVYTMWRASQTAGTIGASMAAAGTAAGGASAWIGEALKGSVVGGLKIAAISGAVGLGILGGYGAVKGALEARSGVKDLSTIASVTEEGSSPANGGSALSWAQLYPSGTPTGIQQAAPEMGQTQPVPGYGNSAYGVPSYGSPIFFQQPRPQMSAVSGMMSPQQLRGLSGH